MIVNLDLFKKKKVIKEFLFNFYKDVKESNGEYTYNCFSEAEKMYKKLIKNDEDLSYYYNKIKKRDKNYA